MTVWSPLIIDVNTMNYQIIETEYNDAYYIDATIADKQFHVICKVNSLNSIPNTTITTNSRLRGTAIHLQWSSTANIFEEVYQFEKGLNAFRPRPFIHFLKSKNSFLAICNGGNLIIIKKRIQVIDLNTMEVMISDIRGPGSSTYWFYAASYHDHNDELLINGYVKECVGVDKFMLVPMDILDLVIRHYNTEWIYVFQQHDSLAPKWRILADDIILSCKRRLHF